MTFTHKRNPIVVNYTINGQPLQRFTKMRDLGVMMDPKLSFRFHMEFIKNKADSTMAFVKRECYKSFNMDVAKILYSSLVISIIEFGSTIWKPYHISNEQLIESTQKRVIIYLNGDNLQRRTNGYKLPPYIQRCNDLGFETLVRRRLNTDVLFIKKIISSQINSPALRNSLI